MDSMVNTPKGEQVDVVEVSPKRRLVSLDTYRGLIMVLLVFGEGGVERTARRFPDSGIWQTIKYHFSHVQWVGCAVWDMIQPSFMFMVGVAMAYSYAKRRSLGHSYPRMLGHAAWRAVVLILLGVFLRSNWSQQTNWTFMDVISQIGLGYVFLFLLWGRGLAIQATCAIAILLAVWGAYTFYPDSGVSLETGKPAVSVSTEWAQEHLADVGTPWHKNANIGHAIDVEVLNEFPREKPFEYDRGGYQTINFIPSLVTMLFGLMCGELLRSRRSDHDKVIRLLTAGGCGIVLGLLLHYSGICPIVKRIWTPSWTLYSGGWCILILVTLYALIDIKESRWWTKFFIIVGMNSIAIYCAHSLFYSWIAKTLRTHLGQDIFKAFGEAYEPMIETVAVASVLWLMCYWMYRRKIFLRV